MKFKAVLFDIDGTLISLDAVVKAIQKTCADLNYPVLSKQEIYGRIVGYSLREIIRELHGITREQALQFAEKYHENYIQHYVSHLNPHAKQVLQTLKDKHLKIGIVSTKERVTAVQTIKDNSIPHDVMIVQEDVKEVKPSPEPVLLACKKLRIKPKDAVMVGDHIFDVQSARSAGAYAVGITTGCKTRKELEKAGAQLVIDDLKEILELIE